MEIAWEMWPGLWSIGLLDVVIVVMAVGVWPLILMSRKQPVVMLAWLLAVTFLPVAGPAFFLLFGRERRLPGLPRKKLRSDRALRRRLEGGNDNHSLHAPDLSSLPESVRGPLVISERLGSHPLTEGNQLRLLNGAREKYKALLADIDGARHHVHLEYFKLRDDRFGNQLAEALMAKARQGVEVRLLIDGVGSFWLSRRFIARLRKSGVRFRWFHPLNPFLGRWSLNIRNHRKIAVIDQRAGYLGGINLGDEYLGRGPIGSEPGEWHDLSIRLEGPAVHSLQQIFREDWHFSTGEMLAGPEYSLPMDSGQAPGALVQIVSSFPSDDLITEMHQAYFSSLTAARSRAWLMTPYFLPDEAIQIALAHLALRGVDVRVVVTDRIQEWIVRLASRSFFLPMLENGVRIYDFRPDATLHGKALLIDQSLMIIGSANLDHRSFRINFETGALIEHEGLARDLESYFLEKMKGAQEWSLESARRKSWAMRGVESLARLAAPLF